MLNRLIPAAILAAAFAFAGTASAQAPAVHVVVVKLAEVGGAKPYAFQPATVTVQHGDTVRFIDGSDMMHNVHFTSEPKGAKLGNAESGPYLTAKGQVYSLVIDNRFTPGTYELVCDPHQSVGMHATLTVTK